MSFSDRDNGLKALMVRLKGAKNIALTVGVHGPEGAAAHGEGLTVVQLATIHEFGLGHNPPRSFIRSWFEENQAANTDNLRKIGAAVLEGKFTADQGLERAGVLFVAQIQSRMAAGIPPPLSKKYADRKGSTVPLIDTGQLKSSITFKVGPNQGG